ncbi:Hypothetical predicted protein, partial [Marmota monax]
DSQSQWTVCTWSSAQDSQSQCSPVCPGLSVTVDHVHPALCSGISVTVDSEHPFLYAQYS